jgi:asparagine synthase (glutamine-hydrolysing)
MAHSLEARCPLLDHRVIELAATQSSARHGDMQVTKRLFRDVIRAWVPEAVLSRPKRGFGVPLRRWFQEQMIGWAREILLDPHTAQRGCTRPAAAARRGIARPRETHLGARLSRALGAPARGRSFADAPDAVCMRS